MGVQLRFKFQGPNGSIIMEFDDNSTVFQARTLLSQTVDRKVKGLVAVADKLTNGSTSNCSSQSQHSVVRLADNQRMKDVDKRAVIMMDCEKVAVNHSSKAPGKDNESSKQHNNSTDSGLGMSNTNGETNAEPATANQQSNTQPKQGESAETNITHSLKTTAPNSSISSFLSTAALAMSSTSQSTDVTYAGQKSNGNQYGSILPSAGLAPLPFNFSPFLLMPAVLKYCIHFEIDKFNINAEIFSHATMGCNAATMEKVLLLPAGEYMDGSGKFLPIVKHFMLQESERAQVYEVIKLQLKAAAAASVTSTLENNLTQSAINNNNNNNQLNPMLKANDSLTNGTMPHLNNNFLLQNNFGSLENLFTMNKNHSPAINTLNNLHFLNSAVQRDPIVATLQSTSTTNNPVKALDITTMANSTNPTSAQTVSPTSSKSAQNNLVDLSKPGGPNLLNQLNQHQQSSTVDSTSGSIKRMRRRTTISRSAKMVMLEWYLSNGRYLTADGRTLLSSHLGLTEENVRVFFKNLRRLEKKCEESGVSLYDAINRVDNEASSLTEDINLLSQQSFNDDEEDSSPTMIKVETLE